MQLVLSSIWTRHTLIQGLPKIQSRTHSVDKSGLRGTLVHSSNAYRNYRISEFKICTSGKLLNYSEKSSQIEQLLHGSCGEKMLSMMTLMNSITCPYRPRPKLELTILFTRKKSSIRIFFSFPEAWKINKIEDQSSCVKTITLTIPSLLYYFLALLSSWVDTGHHYY